MQTVSQLHVQLLPICEEGIPSYLTEHCMAVFLSKWHLWAGVPKHTLYLSALPGTYTQAAFPVGNVVWVVHRKDTLRLNIDN